MVFLFNLILIYSGRTMQEEEEEEKEEDDDDEAVVLGSLCSAAVGKSSSSWQILSWQIVSLFSRVVPMYMLESVRRPPSQFTSYLYIHVCLFLSEQPPTTRVVQPPVGASGGGTEGSQPWTRANDDPQFRLPSAGRSLSLIPST